MKHNFLWKAEWGFWKRNYNLKYFFQHKTIDRADVLEFAKSNKNCDSE